MLFCNFFSSAVSFRIPFIPSTMIEWSKLDVSIHNASYFEVFKKQVLFFIRPSGSSQCKVRNIASTTRHVLKYLKKSGNKTILPWTTAHPRPPPAPHTIPIQENCTQIIAPGQYPPRIVDPQDISPLDISNLTSPTQDYSDQGNCLQTIILSQNFESHFALVTIRYFIDINKHFSKTYGRFPFRIIGEIFELLSKV